MFFFFFAINFIPQMLLIEFNFYWTRNITPSQLPLYSWRFTQMLKINLSVTQSIWSCALDVMDIHWTKEAHIYPLANCTGFTSVHMRRGGETDCKWLKWEVNESNYSSHLQDIPGWVTDNFQMAAYEENAVEL